MLKPDWGDIHLAIFELNDHGIAFGNLTPVPRGHKYLVGRVPHLPAVPHLHVNWPLVVPVSLNCLVWEVTLTYRDYVEIQCDNRALIIRCQYTAEVVQYFAAGNKDFLY